MKKETKQILNTMEKPKKDKLEERMNRKHEIIMSGITSVSRPLGDQTKDVNKDKNQNPKEKKEETTEDPVVKTKKCIKLVD